jgi:hypothetical protein
MLTVMKSAIVAAVVLPFEGTPLVHGPAMPVVIAFIRFCQRFVWQARCHRHRKCDQRHQSKNK